MEGETSKEQYQEWKDSLNTATDTAGPGQKAWAEH